MAAVAEIAALDAKREAIALLRRRLDKGWSRQEIERTIYEGAGGPGMLGYLMSAGKISVPGFVKHGDNGGHTFELAALLDEIENVSVQPELFGW